MTKKKKNSIEVRWVDLKKKSKAETLNIKELDALTCDLIARLGILTEMGVTELDGVPLDLYKDRVWWVVEKIGLLPEYSGDDIFEEIEEDIEEKKDDYYKVEEDFDVEIDDSKFYR